MTLSQLMRVMPSLKDDGFYYYIIDEHYPLKWQWISSREFLNKYDCKKLQVIRVGEYFHYSYDSDTDYALTLKIIYKKTDNNKKMENIK